MAYVSELIIAHPELTSFAELEGVVAGVAEAGEVLLYIDIRPEYPDTPREWQQRLEVAFYGAGRRNP